MVNHCIRCNRIIASENAKECYLCEIVEAGEDIYALIEDGKIGMWSNIETSFEMFSDTFERKTYTAEEFERIVLMQE